MSGGGGPIRAVTFDATGTLFHCPRLGEIYSEVLGRHGIEVEESAVLPTFSTVWRELDCAVPSGRDRFTHRPGGSRRFWTDLVTRLCALLDRPPPSRFAVAELWERFSRPDAWELYPEVPEVLDRLRAAGLRTAVISNWDERLPTLLEGLDLDRSFDLVTVSALVGHAKPHPGIFHQTLSRLGVAAGNALHVGDGQIEDYEGAQAAGLGSLWLDRRSGEGELGDLRPLPDLVEGSGATSPQSGWPGRRGRQGT